MTRIQYEAEAYDFAISVDGRHIYVLYNKNVLQVYETVTGRETTNISYDTTAYSIYVSHDERFVAVTDAGGVYIVFLSINEMVEEICLRLTRNLTAEEKGPYLTHTVYHKTCNKLPVHSSYVEETISQLANSGNIEAFYSDMKSAWPDIEEPRIQHLAALGFIKRVENLLADGRIEAALASMSYAKKLEQGVEMTPLLLNQAFVLP